MPQSKITVKIVTFRPHYMGGSLAEMSLEGGGSTVPPDDGHVTVPTSYKVNLIRAKTLHKVTFKVIAHPKSAQPYEKYLPVGIYFINRLISAPPSNRNIGAHVFKTFECAYSDANGDSSLTLNLERGAVSENEQYEFILLVQRLSDGAMGIIDPEWENN